MSRKDITLRSDKADRWREAKADVDAYLGVDASDSAALMLVIATSEFGDGRDWGEVDFLPESE